LNPILAAINSPADRLEQDADGLRSAGCASMLPTREIGFIHVWRSVAPAKAL
jgi:hypothetical protein